MTETRFVVSLIGVVELHVSSALVVWRESGRCDGLSTSGAPRAASVSLAF